VKDYASAAAGNARAYAAFFQAMLAAGIYLAPSPFEAMFVSAAHDDADVARTLEAARAAFQAAARLMDPPRRSR
jgi:glutamate-1-semialdehyde 2,1-aminomutase